jgi:hypothetical protein
MLNFFQMRTFSKVVLICNICFIIAAVMRLIEFWFRKNGNNEALIPLPFLVGTIAILGVLISFFLNIAFAALITIQKSLKKKLTIPLFILYFNLIMLPVQVWYFFFSKI